MASWDDLTINELKQVLNDANIDYQSSACRKKADFIKLCSPLSKRSLSKALERFSKSSGSKSTSQSGRTPKRSSRSQSQARSNLYSDDISDFDYSKSSNSSSRIDSVKLSKNNRKSLLPNSSTSKYTSQYKSPYLSALQDDLDNSSKQTSLSNDNTESTLVKAGRFSVPSNDLLLSPTRRRRPTNLLARNEKDSLSEVSRLSSSTNLTLTTTQESKLSSFNKVQDTILKESYWPAFDPDGNPIRWQIRDPFICDINSEDNISSTSDSATKQSKSPALHSPLKQKVKLFPNIKMNCRCFFLILSVILTLIVSWKMLTFVDPNLIHKTYQIPSKLMKYWQSLPFCDTNQPYDPAIVGVTCQTCPPSARCKKGEMICKTPQFVKKWQRGQWMCLRNSELYTRSRVYLNRISDVLSELQGLALCNEKLPNEAVRINQNLLQPQDKLVAGHLSLWGYPHCYLNKLFSLNSSTSAEDLVFVFDELLYQKETLANYNLRNVSLSSIEFPSNSCVHETSFNSNNLVKTFYSLTIKTSLSCRIKHLIQAYGFFIFLLIFLLVTIIKSYRSWIQQSNIIKALKKIIEENTSIQYFAKSDTATQQGYAIGPRALDILTMIRGHANQNHNLSQHIFKHSKNYPEYTHLFKHFNEKKLQNVCDTIVRNDSHFCRSLLSVDMIPFYYSKKMVNRLRHTNHLKNNNQTTVYTTGISSSTHNHVTQYEGKILI